MAERKVGIIRQASVLTEERLGYGSTEKLTGQRDPDHRRVLGFAYQRRPKEAAVTLPEHGSLPKELVILPQSLYKNDNE